MTLIETPSRIEPARIDAPEGELLDLVADLAAKAEVLGRALHPTTAANLARLVRIMNTYYSNLIEGHNTRPREIEQALAGIMETHDAARRNLQIEAAAHYRVQEAIDVQARAGTLGDPAALDFICGLHRAFYDGAGETMLIIGEGARAFRMEPGTWRYDPAHDVSVGRHVPPSSDRVAYFMAYFHRRFTFDPAPGERLLGVGEGRARRMLALATAHHRFNYIHPFPDGNGRVSRLMSHAMAHRAGIGAHGLWSISRGLARGLEHGPGGRLEYRQYMAAADEPRQNDRDGRGNLSLSRLTDFTIWFLRICLDQIDYMSGLFDLDALGERLTRYVARSESLAPEAARLLQEALIRGSFERGEASRITGLPERTARRVLKGLTDEGLPASETEKGAVSLRFPSHILEALFPRLYPNMG